MQFSTIEDVALGPATTSRIIIMVENQCYAFTSNEREIVAV